ncbi:hypothetical protein CERZMDRAFT_30945, partial [Cercospora zeae-maydis SCOH1-5]
LSPIRNSSTASLPDHDPVVTCVRTRAAEYQGFVNLSMMESLQITQYTQGQVFLDHYDFREPEDLSPGMPNRETTFFGILDATCTECGTSFPRIRSDWATEDPRWCRIVDCNSTSLIVRPIPGSVTFWVNLLEDGSGDERVLHAGLPPKAESARKIGLNIWTATYV